MKENGRMIRMRANILIALLIALLPCAWASSACRDQNSWPFSNTSIWNTPLGTGAVFSPAMLFPADMGPAYAMQSDDDYFIVTSASDPIVPWYNQVRQRRANESSACAQ